MPHHHSVDGPGDRAAEDPEVADGESEAEQHPDIAPRNDGDDAGERQGDAGRLHGRHRLAVEDARQHNDEDRRGGVDQADIGGGRGLRSDVDDGAAHHHAEEAEDEQVEPLPPHRTAGAPQRLADDRQQQQGREFPATEGQRHGRHRVCHGARDQHVAGEQHRRHGHQRQGDALVARRRFAGLDGGQAALPGEIRRGGGRRGL